MKTVKMTCPNCGASLTVPTDISRLNCTNCGTELALIQGEGYISLKTVETRLRQLLRRVLVRKNAGAN